MINVAKYFKSVMKLEGRNWKIEGQGGGWSARPRANLWQRECILLLEVIVLLFCSFFFKERRRFISIMVITKSLFLILQLPPKRPSEKYTPTPKVDGRQGTGNQQVKLLIPLTECRYPPPFCFSHFEIFEVQF